jgi:hypothetical protein
MELNDVRMFLIVIVENATKFALISLNRLASLPVFHSLRRTEIYKALIFDSNLSGIAPID